MFGDGNGGEQRLQPRRAHHSFAQLRANRRTVDDYFFPASEESTFCRLGCSVGTPILVPFRVTTSCSVRTTEATSRHCQANVQLSASGSASSHHRAGRWRGPPSPPAVTDLRFVSRYVPSGPQFHSTSFVEIDVIEALYPNSRVLSVAALWGIALAFMIGLANNPTSQDQDWFCSLRSAIPVVLSRSLGDGQGRSRLWSGIVAATDREDAALRSCRAVHHRLERRRFEGLDVGSSARNLDDRLTVTAETLVVSAAI